MTRPIATTARSEDAQPGQIVFLIGGEQPEHLHDLLGSYLSRPDVERVVLLTATPSMAARVAAPFAAHREDGRLATVLAWDDIDGAIRAARRGWGEPDVLLRTPLERQAHPIGLAAD